LASTLTDEPVAPDEPGDRPRRIRARGLVAGLVLTAPVCYAVLNAWQSMIFSMMVPPISALLFLILLNVVLRRVSPRLAFSQTDLIVAYAIVGVAAATSAEWAGASHVASYALPLKAQTDATYRDYLMKYIPDWMAVKDLSKVNDISGGGRGMEYVVGKIPVFLPVWLAWAAFYCSVMLAMLCINSLMREAWTQRERLAYPLIQLPVEMSEGGGKGGMWKSKAMWIAFAVMFSIDILNGLNYLYPNVPALPVKSLFDIADLFKDPPLSNMGEFRISIYPFMAAIGLFVPSDLLLSLIVFYLLRVASHVVLANYGIPQGTFSGTGLAPGPPYFDEQTWGGVFALFLGALWVSKDYLRQVWREIRSGVRSSDGGIPHRWAFAGLIVTFSIVVVFGYIGGIPVAYMIPYVAAFLIFGIVLTRIRAQLGPPTHEFAFFGPTALMSRFVGTRWMSDSQITYLNQLFILGNRIHRTHPMPLQLEAMKMGQMRRLNQRTMFWALVAATVLGFFLSYFFITARVYRTGVLGGSDVNSYISNMIGDRRGPDIVGISMTIFGFAMVLLLDAIRFKIPAFPFHPAGYVLAMNYGVDYYWFGLLLALLVKNFVQRYYGLRGYDKLRSVALGILLGEYAAETIWMVMALVTKQSTYTISFNDRSLGAQ
jgi:hypothetical protein